MLICSPCGAPSRAGDDFGKWFGKRDARTGGIVTPEPPHVQVELNRHTRPRQISYGALILAMNTGRLEPTERTESSRLRRYQIEDDSLTGGCEGRETEASRPR